MSLTCCHFRLAIMGMEVCVIFAAVLGSFLHRGGEVGRG